MRAAALALVLIVAWFAASGAEYALLHSVTVECGGAATCSSDSVAVYFDMLWEEQVDDETFIALDYHPHWHDGEVGSIDYTPANASTFGDIASGLTNGLDEYVDFLVHVVSVGGWAGWGDQESDLGFGDPDLAGAEVQLIRLIVEELAVCRDGDWVTYEGTTTWEFWGEPDAPVLPVTWGRVKSLYR